MTLLLIRGVALWLLVPCVVLAYPFIAMRRRATLGQVFGWADLNLVALLQCCLPCSAFTTRLSFVLWQDVGSVTHRIGTADPA